jgi:hypothetical protein
MFITIREQELEPAASAHYIDHLNTVLYTECTQWIVYFGFLVFLISFRKEFETEQRFLQFILKQTNKLYI